MYNSPTIARTEEDRAPILPNRSPSLKESTPTVPKVSSNEKKAVMKSKSGVQRGKERLAKEKALKKEFIPAHSLLPSGIKDIQDFKNIRASQKRQKRNIQPKTFKLPDDISIANVILTSDSKYAIVGTTGGSIFKFDIQNNQVDFRLDEAHSVGIDRLAFGGKDNKYLISTFDDGMIKFFEWQEKFEVVHTIQRESGFKTVVGNEEYLAVCNHEDEVELYSLDELSSEPVHVFEVSEGEEINGLALDKHHNHLFISKDYSVDIYDTETFEFVYTFEDAHGSVYLYAMRVSEDGELLVTAAEDMSIKIWDVTEREEIHSFDHMHSDLINSVLLSSDKRFLISWSVKGNVKVTSLDTGLTIHNFETGDTDQKMEVDLSPNGKFLLTSMDDELSFWDFDSGEYFLRDEGYNSQALHGESRHGANSKFFVRFSDEDDQIIHICDMESGEIFDLSGKIELKGNSNLMVSPNGEYIICYQKFLDSSTVTVYHQHKDLKTEIAIEERITAFAISSDSRFFIYSNDFDVKFIDVTTKVQIRVFAGISEHQVENLWMSPNGNYITVDTLDQSISLIDLTSEEIFIFRDIHENKIHSLAFSFDSQYFVTTSQDKSIKVFDIQTKQLVHQFSAIDDTPANHACFGPDNKCIITGSIDVHLYDLQTKSHSMTIENPRKKEGYGITEVAISPNGKTLFFDSVKKFKGYPEIYRLDPNLGDRNNDKLNHPPSEEDLIYYSFFKGCYSRFNSIEDSLLKSNRPRAEVFSKILKSNFCLLPYSWNVLHIAAIDGDDGFIKDMPKYEDFKISFLLDKYEKTPLHYMIAQDKITYSSVNIMLTYICDYLDDCGDKKKHEYQQIIKSLNPLCWFILLKCEIKLRERFLSLCFIDSPTPYKMELPIFGEPTNKSTYFAQSPEVTPEIREIIWDEGQDQVWFKTNLLYLDYNLTSDDMGKTIECLLQQDSEELFRTPLVSKLLKHLWSQSKMTLYILLALFSVFMTCLSVYIALHDRILAFEIVILSMAGLLLVGETLQMSTAKMDYLMNPWNMLDLIQLLMTVAFIITRFTDDDDDLARSWMSTVIILAGYFRWVSYLCVFQPIRNFMEIFRTVVKDMFSFGVIIGFIIIGFSITFVAFGIGNEAATEFGPYGAYLYNAYNSLFGPVGNPDYGSYELSQNILIAVIAFLLNVILLNLLISIMGESMNNVLAMRDKTETLTKFNMIMEAVTFMKFFKRGKANVSNKTYLVYCFSLQSEESKGAPESEMELRIGKKFVELKEDFGDRLDNIEEYLEENKRLSAQLADFKEFYLRTRGLKEFDGLKRKYKDIKRLEKKLEHAMEGEDHDDEDESGDDDDISSLDGKRNDIRVNKSFTGKVEPESVAAGKPNLEERAAQDNRI